MKTLHNTCSGYLSVCLVFFIAIATCRCFSPVLADEDEGIKRETDIQGLSWSPDGQKIVFSTNRTYEKDGGDYLWTVGVDGKNLKQLTFPIRNQQKKLIHFGDESPQWSPNGKKIIFESNRGEKRQDGSKQQLRQVFVCTADGSNMVQLSSGQGWFENFSPSWSPDGKQIAWVTNRNASADIMLGDAQGREVRYLAVTNKLSETFPSWSQDGKYIVFVTQKEWIRDYAKEGSQNICLRSTSVKEPPQTTNARVLYSNPKDYGLIEFCSPTKNVLAFVKDSFGEIWQINFDGTGLKPLLSMKNSRTLADYFVRPAWSPKGDKIAFVAPSQRPLPPDVYEQGIWILDVATGKVKEVPLPQVKETS